MNVAYIEEAEEKLSTLKSIIEDEKKEIADCQNKFSTLLKSFSQKAPSSGVINSLFKDDEPEGLNFSKYEEKRKQLAEQRRAEYNAYLEKKEAERLPKQRSNEEIKSVSPRSILDAVDYDRVLAMRKEEEAKFRTMNHADVLHSFRPVLSDVNVDKPNLKLVNGLEQVLPPLVRTNGVNSNYSAINLPGAIAAPEESNAKLSMFQNKMNLDALERENARLLEERIAKHLEQQRHQMLLEFENELKKNNKIKEEIRSLKSSGSIGSSSKRVIAAAAENFPKQGRTGGGGDPVRDSFGNLITMRGLRKESKSDGGSLMSFPPKQQQPQDRMALYREELQKQIEEKRRLEALEREKLRKQEEKIAERIEEQRLQMQKEYESELQKNNKAKEEFQRQQERIRKLEEFQRKDAEARCRKPVQTKPSEFENLQPAEIVNERSHSPPIPAVRTKVLFEKAIPPVTEVNPENVFSSLAEIRKKIMEEQQKSKEGIKKSYEVMNRRTIQEVSDDEEDDILETSPF